MVDAPRHPVTREPGGSLAGRRITLCVTGSIAAFKAVLVLRLLQSEGAELEVVLTDSAQRFVGAATFSGLTGKPVFTDMFDPSAGGELHVDIAARSDLILIVPATADLLARLAGGRADDLVSAIALCARCPLLVVPAMHPTMWEHPATRRNVDLLGRDGLTIVGPVDGPVASGASGMGRMAEPEEVLAAVVSQLGSGELAGRHIVVTSGPTVEDIDPVRFISNRSSGKMGFALASRAAARGARVTLISGPVNLPTPARVQRIDVRSASSMQSALWEVLHPDLSHADALIMAAAVGDYRLRQTHAHKLKRDADKSLMLALVANEDLLAGVAQARAGKRPILVGFALETAESDDKLVESARSKLAAKRVDLVVANAASEVLAKEDNRAILVDAERALPLNRLPKLKLADKILDWLADRLAETEA